MLEVAHSRSVVLSTEHCLPGGSGTQYHHLLPSGHSGLELEGLYRVLPTTTPPQQQCSLGIICPTSRTAPQQFSSITQPK